MGNDIDCLDGSLACENSYWIGGYRLFVPKARKVS
jgi:hypothetical protein